MTASIHSFSNVDVSKNPRSWPQRWIWVWDSIFSQFRETGVVWLHEEVEGRRWWMAAFISPRSERKGNWNWEGVVSDRPEEAVQSWLIGQFPDQNWSETANQAELRGCLEKAWSSFNQDSSAALPGLPAWVYLALIPLGPFDLRQASIVAPMNLSGAYPFVYTVQGVAPQKDVGNISRWILNCDDFSGSRERSAFLRQYDPEALNAISQSLEKWFMAGASSEEIHVALCIKHGRVSSIPGTLAARPDTIWKGFDLLDSLPSTDYFDWVKEKGLPFEPLLESNRLDLIEKAPFSPAIIVDFFGNTLFPAIKRCIGRMPFWRKAIRASKSSILTVPELWEVFDDRATFLEEVRAKNLKMEAIWFLDHISSFGVLPPDILDLIIGPSILIRQLIDKKEWEIFERLCKFGIPPEKVLALSDPDAIVSLIRNTPGLSSWWFQGLLNVFDAHVADAIFKALLELPEEEWSQQFVSDLMRFLQKSGKKLSNDTLLEKHTVFASSGISFSKVLGLSPNPSSFIKALLQKGSDAIIRWVLSDHMAVDSVATVIASLSEADLNRVSPYIKTSTAYVRVWEKAVASSAKNRSKALPILLENKPSDGTLAPDLIPELIAASHSNFAAANLRKAIAEGRLTAILHEISDQKAKLEVGKLLLDEELLDAAQFRDLFFLTVFEPSARFALPLCAVLWDGAAKEGKENDIEFWLPLIKPISDFRRDLPADFRSKSTIAFLAALQHSSGADALQCFSNSQARELENTASAFKTMTLHAGSSLAVYYRLAEPHRDINLVVQQLKDQCKPTCNCLSSDLDFVQWLWPKLNNDSRKNLADPVKYKDFVMSLSQSNLKEDLFLFFTDWMRCESNQVSETICRLRTLPLKFHEAMILWILSKFEECTGKNEAKSWFRLLSMIHIDYYPLQFNIRVLHKFVSWKLVLRKAGPSRLMKFLFFPFFQLILNKMDASISFLTDRIKPPFDISERFASASWFAGMLLLIGSLVLIWVCFAFVSGGLGLLLAFSLIFSMIFFYGDLMMNIHDK